MAERYRPAAAASSSVADPERYITMMSSRWHRRPSRTVTVTSTTAALALVLVLTVLSSAPRSASAFSPRQLAPTPRPSSSGIRTAPAAAATSRLRMSFYDMSDYKSSSADFDTEEVVDTTAYTGGDKVAAESEVKLHRPPPMSKNAGNTFVALIFDKALDSNGEDKAWDELMEQRVELTGDHVRWCREANLYNETFNGESDVDVLKSYQVLSSCATRPIGHILILESTTLANVKNFLGTDPIVEMLGCPVDSIPLYRWRHVKDHTLRIDEGRYGYPNVLIQMDRPAEELGAAGANLRNEVEKPKLEYLIRSQRVIAAGPLHLPTEAKDDPSSLPIGDIVFFNAMDREEAVKFAEDDPAARAGLYGTMRVHKYNVLDVTGKFVAEDLFDNGEWVLRNRNLRLREEMESEGYPVGDEQTEWLNY